MLPIRQKKKKEKRPFAGFFFNLFILVLTFALCAITDNLLSNTKLHFQFSQSFSDDKVRFVEMIEGKFLKVVQVPNVKSAIF